MAPPLKRGTKCYLMMGVGALHKVLEAYIGEAALPTDPPPSTPEIFLAVMFWVVILLFWQRENHLKNGLPWMKVRIKAIVYLLMGEFQKDVYEGLVTQPWARWSGVWGANHSYWWNVEG